MILAYYVIEIYLKSRVITMDNLVSRGDGDMPEPGMQKKDMLPLMDYEVVFPEIFYRLQPYILMVCDRLNLFGSTTPNQTMIDSISDSIYDDVTKRDPELAEYLQNQSGRRDAAVPAMSRMDNDPRPFGWRFRRRGLPRDLIEILLLSELFGRRRRYYY